MERLSLNGTPFAVGLHWQPPVKRRFLSRKALIDMADSLDADYDVSTIRRCSDGLQAGFGTVGDDWREYAKTPALCTCLDVPQSFLGLFSLRNVDGSLIWWLHLRLDGVIAEPGDKIFSTGEEAAKWLHAMQTASGIEPETFDSPMQSAEWLSEHLHYRPVDKWVLSKGQITSLNRIASRSTVGAFAVTSALLIVCVGAGIAWSHYREQAAQAKAQAERQERLQRKAEMEQYPERFFSPDWQHRPLATDFAGMCLPAMMRVPLSENGWQFNSVTCNGKAVAVAWGHEGGADFTRLPEGARLDEKDMRIARSSTPLPSSIRVVRPDGPGSDYRLLLSRDEVMGLLAEITQSTGTKLSAPNFQAAKSRTIDKVTIHAPWREATWELSEVPDLLLEAAPGEDGVSLFAMLSEIPGLAIDTITYQDGWRIKGKVYARK